MSRSRQLQILYRIIMSSLFAVEWKIILFIIPYMSLIYRDIYGLSRLIMVTSYTKTRIKLVSQNRYLRNPVAFIIKPIGQRIYYIAELEIFRINKKYRYL